MFAVIENIATFVVPESQKIACQSQDYHTLAAHKAGLISGKSFGDNRFGSLARKGKGSAYSFYTTNFLTMPESSRNLTTGAQGASASTPGGAKTVSISTAHPLFKITKKELIALIEGKTCAPSVSDARYSLILAAFLEWIKCEDRGLYASDIRDSKLISRLSAIREAFRSANNQNR